MKSRRQKVELASNLACEDFVPRPHIKFQSSAKLLVIYLKFLFQICTKMLALEANSTFCLRDFYLVTNFHIPRERSIWVNLILG